MRDSTDLTSDPLALRKYIGGYWNEMNFWPSPQAVTHFHTLIEVEQTSPSQTLLPNTVWGISHSHSVEIAYYQVFSVSRFTPFLLRQDSLWSLTLLRLKNFIQHTKKVMIHFDLMGIRYDIQRKRKSDNQRIIPCRDVS